MKKIRKTSKDAFLSITLDHKKSLWARITRTLKKNRAGLTADQVASKLRVDHVQIARRMKELIDAGIVINSPLTRKTRTGRMAIVRVISKKYAA